MKGLFLLFNLLIFLFGCSGYHWEDDQKAPVTSRTPISVPYVEGDREGVLTEELIKAIGLSNRLVFAAEGALTLKGSIVSQEERDIGWKYRHLPKTGDRVNQLIPNERREEVLVECSLFSTCTGKKVSGPFFVKATRDYDFSDPDSAYFLTKEGESLSTLSFSLGQLGSVQDARQTALHSLYRELARKIIFGVENLCSELE